MNDKIDRGFLIETLQNLVKINSVNPRLDPGAKGEEQIGHYIAGVLNDFNIEPEVDLLEPGRVNVTAVISGTGNGSSLMINAHTDTVGVQNMDGPFSAAISDGKLFGRGAMDMKGSIAAMLTMVKAIVENKIELKGDLVITFVADEEYGSIGTENVLRKYKTDAAIVTEPTGLDICLAHKGFGLYEFITRGKAVHGSNPEEGIDANRHMGWIIEALNKLSEKLNETTAHPLLGKPSLHIPVINGGSEPFTYAATCKLILERRILPGETPDQIFSQLKDILDKLSKQNSTFKAEVKQLLWRDPLETDKNNKLVASLFESAKEVIAKEPNFIGHQWWEDSGLINNAGIDTVIIGPKGEGLHTDEEWVDIQSVVDLANILLNVTLRYCN